MKQFVSDSEIRVAKSLVKEIVIVIVIALTRYRCSGITRPNHSQSRKRTEN